MEFSGRLALGCLCLLTACLPLPSGKKPDTTAAAPSWQESMQKVHARFTGQKGTFAQFGDSITVTQAFWAPLHDTCRNASPQMRTALRTVQAYLRPECWRDWKGPDYGSEGGRTTAWAKENVAAWLHKLNPEVALILFGTNDLPDVSVETYRDTLRSVVQRCLDNGTVVILSTIPPRHGYEQKAQAFAAAARQVAQQMHVPLTDFYAEILQRRPDDWDGASDKFNRYQGYDVPTLISRDGVHPSYPARYQGDYSEDALRSCGYGLRNYLTLLKYAEVLTALGVGAPARERSGFVALPRKEQASLSPPSRSWFPKAPPLPPPTGAVLRVSSVPELLEAIGHVSPGGTILLADGLYRVPQPIEIKTDRVTLRSASGQRDRVVLDAGNAGELIRLTACSDVTIADLTVQNVRWNGIKINSETGVQRAVIYNCILHNVWQRAIKGVIVPPQNRAAMRPTGCRVQYCLFYNDHPKQFSDDPTDTEQTFKGNYIGGIDVMYARDWTISDNVFVGIHGRTGEARGAVFLWNETSGCTVERNVILDCDSGICLGNSSKSAETPVHCTGCIVRNNFVVRAHENGILADYTQDCKILNNSIYDPDSRLGRLIRLVHANDGLLVANNLVCGPRIRIESDSRITFANNLEKDLSAALVAPSEGNLRLTARAREAIDHAAPLSEVRDDIDRTPRGVKPDIGAHEFRARHGS
ncbi:MAG TPA: right-handed parallel beta-helix repeat-containing protein [Chthonomonadaceae bacterium]|nr:right-handed parallel beta-helix repeat-containing protein [Chthonomonadaceae bacterium]